MFCRLAIGARSRQCEVNPAFRCIVVVDSERAYTQLPSPLLNRFEKQCLSRSDVLEDEFKKAEPDVWEWCRTIAKMMVGDVSPAGIDLNSSDRQGLVRVMASIFIGFNSESVASILLSLQEGSKDWKHPAGALMKDAEAELRAELSQLKLQILQVRVEAASPGIPKMVLERAGMEGLITMLVGAMVNVRAVKHLVQQQLVLFATPEAVVKYSWLTGRGLNGKKEPEPTDPPSTNMAQLYFEQQTHSSLWDFIADIASTGAYVQAAVMTFSDLTVDLINKPNLVPSDPRQTDPRLGGCPPSLSGATWDVRQLASFAHAADYKSMLEEFFAGDKAGLVVQCGLARNTTSTTVTGPQIHHAKSMAVAARRNSGATRDPGASDQDKHVIFVVHLLKDQSVEGVVVPFAFHAEKDWQYVLIDSVEKPEVQEIPLVQEMLIPNIHQLFGAGDGNLTQTVLMSSLRRCLSRLVYPLENRRGVTIQQRLDTLRNVLEDPDFVHSVMSRVHVVFMHSAKEMMRDGWQGTMERGEVAGAGNYRKALFKRVEGSVTEGFTRLLAAVDGCDNLMLYSKLTRAAAPDSKSPSPRSRSSSPVDRSSTTSNAGLNAGIDQYTQLRSVWLQLAEDESLVPLPTVHQKNQSFEIATPLRARSFRAQYPFSMQLAKKIEGLREVAVLQAAGTGADVWVRLVDLIMHPTSSIAFAGDIGVYAYLEDFAHLKMPPTIGEWGSANGDQDTHDEAEAAMLRIIKSFIIRRAMDKTGKSRGECLQNIGDVHSSYEEVKELLHQVGDLMQLMPTDISSPLLDKMGGVLTTDSRDGLMALVLLVLKAAMSALNPAYALTPVEFRARVLEGGKETWGEWLGGLWSASEGESQQIFEGYVQQVCLMNAYVEYLIQWASSYTVMGGKEDMDNTLMSLDGSFGEARNLPLGDLVDVEHEGWLQKKGRVIKNWRRRWCVVNTFQGQRFLHYFESNMDMKAVPLGMVPLEAPMVQGLADLLAFDLTTKDSQHEGGDTKLVMRAVTSADRDVWMRALAPDMFQGALAMTSDVDQAEEARALDALEALRQTDFVRDHTYHFHTFPNSFSASHAVAWLVDELRATDKEDAVAMGKIWIRTGQVAYVTDSSVEFKDKKWYFHFVGEVFDEEGWESVMAPTDDVRHDEQLRMLNVDWHRTRVFSECVSLALIPLEATLEAGKKTWPLLEASSDLGSLKLLEHVLAYFAKAECENKDLRNVVGPQFGRRYLADHILSQRPRMSTLTFVMRVVAYDGEPGYKSDVDSFLKNKTQKAAVTAGTRMNLMRMLMQYANMSDIADPMRIGIEARALKMIHRKTVKHGDNPLNLIICQVMQDSLTDEMSEMNPEDKIRFVCKLGTDAQNKIFDLIGAGVRQASRYAFDEHSIIDWLMAVAQSRLVIDFTATTMIDDQNGKLESAVRTMTHDYLYPACGVLLENGIIQGQARALEIYFFKQLDRRMGFQAAVQFLTVDFPKISTLFPMPGLQKEFEAMGLEGSNIMPNLDPFIHMHKGTTYTGIAQNLRRCVAVGDYSRDSAGFDSAKRTIAAARDLSVVVSAVFREVYLRHGGSDATNPSNLDWLLSECHKLTGSQELKEFNSKLATNNFDPRSKFHLTPATTLQDVCIIRPIIHLVSGVLDMRWSSGDGCFFKKLLLDPDSFLNQWLPTMPEDEFGEILKTQGDVGIYYCQNGHPYLVGNCTRPDQAGRCMCGAPIGNAKGARSHTMDSSNTFGGFTNAGAHRMKNRFTAHVVDEHGKETDMKVMAGKAAQGSAGVVGGIRQDEDAPQGYALNDYTTEMDKFASCRAITPTTTRVYRFLMHGVLALAHAADLPGDTRASCERLQPGWTSADFVKHMENDFRILTELLSRSAEDVSFNLHLIVAKYLSEVEHRMHLPASSYATGLTKQKRKAFEGFFHNSCVLPVLALEGNLGIIKASCDVSEEPTAKELSAAVTETDPFDQTLRSDADIEMRATLTPLLLRYRRPITYDLFVRSFDMDAELEQKHPIIHSFLKSERELRVIQNVFDIYRFQELVFNTYTRRIGRQEAQETTVGAAIAAIKDPILQGEWRTAYKSFIQGWNAVAPYVTSFECDKEYRLPRLEGDFDRVLLPKGRIKTDMELPIDLAMPNRQKEEFINSIAPVALLQWSTRLHNKVVEDARTSMITRLEEGTARRTRVVTEAQAARVQQQSAPVPTHMLRRSDCISYDFDDFVSCVHACTSQSLEYGQGGQMEFDWEAIEQWIIDNVLAGVPLLQDGIRSFEFRGEGMGLLNMVGNVPQVPLDEKLVKMVITEQVTLQKMQRLQERLREVMGFLRSTEGSPNTLVGTYASGVLQLTDQEMSDLYAADGSAGAVMGMVRLQHVAALDTALSRELRDPLASISSKYAEPLSQQVTQFIQKSAVVMGPANIELMTKSWVHMIEQYFADYQEPFPPATSLKDTLDWMPTVDTGESLNELEFFEKLFPPNDMLLLASMVPALKLYRSLATAQTTPAQAPPPAHTPPLTAVTPVDEMQPEPAGAWEMEPEPEAGYTPR